MADQKPNLPPGRRGQVREGEQRSHGRGRAPPPPVQAPVDPGQSVPSPSNGAKKRKVDDSPPGDHSPMSEEKKELLRELQKMSLSKRPDAGGQQGRQIALRTNHFYVIMKNKEFILQQYHVDCKHERRKLNKAEMKQVFWRCIASNKDVFESPYTLAHDGAHICLSLQKFRFGDDRRFDLEVMLQRDDRPSKCSVTFQYTGQVHIDMRRVASGMERESTPIQALDIILRQGRFCPYVNGNGNGNGSNSYVPAGRSFFVCPDDAVYNRMMMSGGRVIYPGYFASAHVATNWKPMLNMDCTQTAFYVEQDVLPFLVEVMLQEAGRNQQMASKWQANQTSSAFMDEGERRVFERHIKGLRVKAMHRQDQDGNYRVFKVSAVTPKSARQTRQKLKLKGPDGPEEEMSIEEYFHRKGYKPLQYPNMPLLNVGSAKKPILLPMEVCKLIKDQKCNKKLTEDQTTSMIKYACVSAPDREKRVMEQVKKSNVGRDDFCKAFGLDVEYRQVELKGRVLDAPQLEYLDDQGRPIPIKPHQGTWRADRLMGRSPGKCAGWGLIAFLHQNKKSELEMFARELHKACRFFGLPLPQWPDVVRFASRPEELEQLMRECVNDANKERKEARCDLIVVVLPYKNTKLYAETKRVSEILLGVVTQVVLSKNALNAKPTTMNNIALKINAKMGGVNQSFLQPQRDNFINSVLLSQPTLFLGIDVTHPAPLDTRSPSVAAIVGNIDLGAVHYGGTVKVQKQRRESIVYLPEAVKERLVAFYKGSNQTKPTRIIVYRDGVSEGQFKEVLREEMQGIKNACMMLDPNYRPKITFIVVQKRHHTRFFCANQADMTGKACNVPPGTVVDREIVHPEDFDFYLCSHFGIQGTSRPAHYFVLHDDSSFSSDAVQMMTYYMCHIYARCPRTVSIPAPVYYADLVCTRARYHLVSACGDFSDTMSVTSFEEGTDGSSQSEQVLMEQVTVKNGLKNTMYFA